MDLFFGNHNHATADHVTFFVEMLTILSACLAQNLRFVNLIYSLHSYIVIAHNTLLTIRVNIYALQAIFFMSKTILGTHIAIAQKFCAKAGLSCCPLQDQGLNYKYVPGNNL